MDLSDGERQISETEKLEKDLFLRWRIGNQTPSSLPSSPPQVIMILVLIYSKRILASPTKRFYVISSNPLNVC